MSTLTHSRQAQAAQRFVEATRNVDLAFRAVRGEAESHTAPIGHATAVSQLDQALDELARAQELFDSAVSFHARKRN